MEFKKYKHLLYGSLIGAAISMLLIIASFISQDISNYLFGSTLSGSGIISTIFLFFIAGSIIGWMVGLFFESEERKERILLSLNFIIPLLSGYLFLLISGWNNYFNVGLLLSRYGKVSFGAYFITAFVAVVIPFLVMTFFNYLSNKNNSLFLSKYSAYKYIILLGYLLIVFVFGYLSYFYGYALVYIKLLIPLIIIIDLLLISQLYIKGYKKILPLILLFVSLVIIFSLIYFSSPKGIDNLGRCPKEDKNCIDSSYAAQALKLNNLNICYNSPIPERCLTFLAYISHDLSICDNIPNDTISSFKDSCSSDLYNSECMLRASDAEKRECLKKQCEKVIDELNKDSCFNNVDFWIERFKTYGWRN